MKRLGERRGERRRGPGSWVSAGTRAAAAAALTTIACANTGPLQGSAVTAADPGEPQAPRLLVLVVVDQFGADLFEDYAHIFTGGLGRLLAGGRRFADATHDHGITETSPGHATISTGTPPAQHGMVSNLWFTQDERGTWTRAENVIDPALRMTGAETLAGSSPSMLQASGLGDWLVEGNPESRVVSVSGKDRAAILLAGQGVHTVYWFEPQLERFATSTYYREADPDWVVGFNETLAVRLQEDWDWNLEVPDRLLTLARADPAVFEGDGIHTTFPHRFAAEGDTASGGIGAWWSSTPSLDRETTSLAILALSELELGRGNAVDFLALSLSATDRVGHAYGPDSLEQLDNLLRLDAQIGRLLDALDQQVPGRYTLVLTSDHGVSRSPEALQAEGAVARRLTQEDGSRFNERAGEDLRAYGSDPVRLAQALAESARAESWIARAWPDADLAAAASEDSLAALMLESLYPGRAAGLLGRLGVQVVLTPHTLLWAWPRGTDHGSPYLYDRRVPLVFYGAGVAPAVVEGRASTRSIAPTMAWLVGLTTPPGASVAPLVLR